MTASVHEAADRLYAAALNRHRAESDETSSGRLTAEGSADLDYAQDQWQDALGAYVTARKDAEETR
jgi:hypothetical protein